MSLPEWMTGTKTILVHLNVEVPITDTRTANEIADLIVGACEVSEDVVQAKVVCPLAEEIS